MWHHSLKRGYQNVVQLFRMWLLKKAMSWIECSAQFNLSQLMTSLCHTCTLFFNLLVCGFVWCWGRPILPLGIRLLFAGIYQVMEMSCFRWVLYSVWLVASFLSIVVNKEFGSNRQSIWLVCSWWNLLLSIWQCVI